MLPKKTRHILYALLLITCSVVCTTAIANTTVFDLIAEAASVFEGDSADASAFEVTTSTICAENAN